MNEREELEALRRLAALEAKERGEKPSAVASGASAGKGGLAGGAWMGLRDPIDAGAQLLSRGVDAAVQGMNKIPGVSLPRPDVKGVDAIVNKANTEYEDSRKLAGRDGIDGARIVGNVLNPANLAGAKIMQAGNAGRVAMTGRQIAARGAGAGAVGGALQPVIGEQQQENFATSKAVQTGAGAVLGGAISLPVQRAAEGLGRAVNSLAGRFARADDGVVLQQADALLERMARDGGFDLSSLSAGMRAQMRGDVVASLRSGRQFDPAAFARQAEFRALGIQPTKGQVSRDPTQFARERDLRGVQGAGEPLAQRFNEQNAQLSGHIDRLAAGAVDPDVAGGRLMTSLRNADAPVQAKIGEAYGAARDNAGRAAGVDVQAFANTANDALDAQMLGRFLPAEAASLMNDISSGKIPLNVNTLVQADSVLSQAQRAAAGNPAAQKAIGVVRDALNNAPIEGSAGVEAKAAFDTARGMARSRFKVIDETPGLKAALDDEAPDAFVRRYILNGDTRDVNALMRVLGSDADAQAQARAQVAAYLRDKAFGANAAGDKPFAQETYNKAIQSLGLNKLTAIFGAQDAAQLARIGRVAAYMNSQPAGSAVNNSNTGAAVMNLLSRVGGELGSLPGVNVLRDSVRSFANERAARSALNSELRPLPAEISEEARNRLMRYLTAPAAIAGGVTGGALGQ